GAGTSLCQLRRRRRGVLPLLELHQVTAPLVGERPQTEAAAGAALGARRGLGRVGCGPPKLGEVRELLWVGPHLPLGPDAALRHGRPELLPAQVVGDRDDVLEIASLEAVNAEELAAEGLPRVFESDQRVEIEGVRRLGVCWRGLGALPWRSACAGSTRSAG